jgi:diketogulonate reductase-like aldo/keto reductase
MLRLGEAVSSHPSFVLIGGKDAYRDVSSHYQTSIGRSRHRDEEEVQALRLGLDLGMTLIGTAEMYAEGGAEELGGEAIKGRRKDVFLVSKVLPHNATVRGAMLACDRSLRRLRTGTGEATDRVLYNLARRGPEYDLLPWCRQRHIPIMAYSPIEQGRILKHSTLEAVAIRHSATPAQVALAWVLQQDGVIAIPKAGSVHRSARIEVLLEFD